MSTGAFPSIISCMQSVESAPVPLVIYGVPFHNVSYDEALDWIVARVRSGQPSSRAITL